MVKVRLKEMKMLPRVSVAVGKVVPFIHERLEEDWTGVGGNLSFRCGLEFEVLVDPV